MDKSTKEAVKNWAEVGGILAMIISWSLNKSIGWAILHCICGWLYVIYYGIFL